jgi:sulfatase maturation enzyme AslB (radical SAM superfamily)
MKKSTVEKTVSFFYPYFNDKTDIVFFGGEPLLCFDIVKHAVHCVEKRNKNKEKRIIFTLTTNGSLLTDNMLSFFNRNVFRLVLSFDGLTQDSGRKSGSLQATRELVPRIRSYPKINFIINCVCTPATVSRLTESVKYIIETGGADIQLNIDETVPWDDGSLESLKTELGRLTDFLLAYYREIGSIPVLQFRPESDPYPTGGRFVCSAGRGRISIGPEENIMGCILFHPYLKNRKGDEDFNTFSFGKLDDFINDHHTIYPRIRANYNTLRQDAFFTEDQFCYLCEDVDHCSNCPPYFAFTTSFIGKIPTWRCRIVGIRKRTREQFMKKIEPLEKKDQRTGTL